MPRGRSRPTRRRGAQSGNLLDSLPPWAPKALVACGALVFVGIVWLLGAKVFGGSSRSKAASDLVKQIAGTDPENRIAEEAAARKSLAANAPRKKKARP